VKCAEQFADITANTAVTLLESRQVFLGRSIINVLQSKKRFKGEQ
jgi:hypothetical protein